MSGNCGKISESILIDCANPLVGGVKDRLVLFNFEDQSVITRDGTNPQLITGISLTTSPVAKAYQFEGKNHSNDVKSTLVKGKYSENYDHEVIFRIFGNSAAIKKQIEAMAKGKFVAIIENNFKGNGGDAAFEIFGLDVGLDLMAMEANKSDQDTQGAYVLTLRTPDTFKEPHLPASLFLTDYATTKAIVDALL
jgi:hypothetical protein